MTDEQVLVVPTTVVVVDEMADVVAPESARASYESVVPTLSQARVRNRRRRKHMGRLARRIVNVADPLGLDFTDH